MFVNTLLGYTKTSRCDILPALFCSQVAFWDIIRGHINWLKRFSEDCAYFENFYQLSQLGSQYFGLEKRCTFAYM